MKYRSETTGTQVTFTFPAKPGVSIMLDARGFQSGAAMVREAIRQAEDQ